MSDERREGKRPKRSALAFNEIPRFLSREAMAELYPEWRDAIFPPEPCAQTDFARRLGQPDAEDVI